MGFDAVRGVATYGAKCLDGCARQFAWWQARYQAGTLGCYNPASKAGGGPSLHAEGRAMDIALNANDPAQRARGDAIVALVVAHPEAFGAQEMLWAGGVWTWRRRAEGWRTNPPTQQAAHMNHVHLGLDVNAGLNWTEAWLGSLGLDGEDEGDQVNPTKVTKLGNGALGQFATVPHEDGNGAMLVSLYVLQGMEVYERARKHLAPNVRVLHGVLQDFSTPEGASVQAVTVDGRSLSAFLGAPWTAWKYSVTPADALPGAGTPPSAGGGGGGGPTAEQLVAATKAGLAGARVEGATIIPA